MTDELKNFGLYALPADIRAKKLARMGMTEDEYREKAIMQMERNKRFEEAEARGESPHGWSDKAENPGWSDDKIVGSVESDE